MTVWPDSCVERGGRLVADQQLRLVDQGPGDGDALLLAAGELRRQASAFSPMPSAPSIARRRGHGLRLAASRRSAAASPRSRPPSAPAAGCTAGRRSRCSRPRNSHQLPARQRRQVVAEHARPSPLVASSMPAMIEMSVVLPQPDGPTSSVISPAAPPDRRRAARAPGRRRRRTPWSRRQTTAASEPRLRAGKAPLCWSYYASVIPGTRPPAPAPAPGGRSPGSRPSTMTSTTPPTRQHLPGHEEAAQIQVCRVVELEERSPPGRRRGVAEHAHHQRLQQDHADDAQVVTPIAFSAPNCLRFSSVNR